MIDVFFSRFNEKMPQKDWDFYISQLPASIREKINRYVRWQDRHSCLLGKLLLSIGLQKYGYEKDSLSLLLYNKFGKPFLNNNIDFNISHSGSCVVCAITTQQKLGIDIERIRPIELSDFKNYINSQEWDSIVKKKKYDSFFDIWTQKESILKAYGTGLATDINQIFIQDDVAYLKDTKWFLIPLDIDMMYKCYLATNKESQGVQIHHIKW